jgi:hypothetical protein
VYPVHGAIQDGPDTTVGTFAAGGAGQPTGRGGRAVPTGTHVYANWAVIAWFLIAAVALVGFDRAGFKFMVKVGRG